jgi:hypothetical protein
MLTDDAGAPLDVSKNTLQSKIKSARGTDEFSLIIDSSKADNGVLTVSLPLIPVGSYIFDIVMNGDQNQSNVIVTGTIRIIKGVTL